MLNNRLDTPHKLDWRAIGLEAALYLALTFAVTWPLVTDLTGTFPSDYGDPLFVSWVMSWVMKQLTAILTGDITAINGFWQAPIFYPERNTLALSEHFVPQSVLALPVWWATSNLILTYNVAVITTFVLTALGTSLLVQELTGSRLAGIFAGIIASFNPLRLLLELNHLHTLSIQWLPLALLGVHRFVRTRSAVALVFGAGSVLALNLSSAYYLLYCAPFITLFTLLEVILHRKLIDARVWTGLAVAGVGVGLAMIPFVMPYMNMQHQQGFQRSIQELLVFAATLDHYRIVLPWLGIAIGWAAMGLIVIGHHEARGWRRYAIVFGVFTLLTVWLSLGPVPQARGQRMPIPSLYLVLYDWMPGFNGLRVVSRYAAVMLIFLSVSAGLGAAWLARFAPRAGRVLIIATTAWFLWQVWPAPFQVNSVLPPVGFELPPAHLTPSSRLPEIYSAVARLDGDAVIAELPFGDSWYDVRYMFFAATHGRRLINGYSGFIPASYARRQQWLMNPLAAPEAARKALSDATHVVVHERGWNDDTGQRISTWLQSLGGVVVAESDGAKLVALESLHRDARLPNPTR